MAGVAPDIDPINARETLRNGMFEFTSLVFSLSLPGNHVGSVVGCGGYLQVR